MRKLGNRSLISIFSLKIAEIVAEVLVNVAKFAIFFAEFLINFDQFFRDFSKMQH